MNSNAGLNIALARTLRERQLRYVTENFSNLQTLKVGPLWILLLLIMAIGESLPHSRTKLVWIAYLALFAFFAAWAPTINRWYKHRYGFVEESKLHVLQGRQRRLLGWLIMSVLFLELSLLHEWVTFSSLLPLTLTLPGCFYPASSMRITRIRRELYIGGSVSILFLALIGGWRPTHPWILMTGSSLIVLLLGTYDQWLLDRLLGGTGEIADA